MLWGLALLLTYESIQLVFAEFSSNISEVLTHQKLFSIPQVIQPSNSFRSVTVARIPYGTYFYYILYLAKEAFTYQNALGHPNCDLDVKQEPTSRKVEMGDKCRPGTRNCEVGADNNGLTPANHSLLPSQVSVTQVQANQSSYWNIGQPRTMPT